MPYTLEQFYRVYDDSTGSYYEICPDADALNCVEIRYCADGDGKPESQLMVPPEMARLIAEAMLKVAMFFELTADK